VGGGVSGASLACALSASQHFTPDSSGKEKIVLLESGNQPDLTNYSSNEDTDRTPDAKVITLSPNSLRFLRSVGALQASNHQFLTPFTDMIVYEQSGSSYLRFSSDARQRSHIVQMQEQFLNGYVFDQKQKEKFDETSISMGASIESAHL